MDKNRNALKWIYSYTKPQGLLWWVVLLAVITGLISGGFIVLAVLSQRVLDIATGDMEGNIYFEAGLIMLVIALQAALNILHANIRIRAFGKIEIRIRQGVFGALLRKNWQEITKIHSGEILNRFTSDTQVVTEGIVDIIPYSISILTKIIAGLAVLLYIDYRFTLAVVGVGVIVFLASRIYSKHFKYLHKMVQEKDGIVRSFIQECVENLVVIKSFANDRAVSSKLMDKQKEGLRVKIKRTAVGNIANTGVYVLFTASYYVALIWGATRIARGLLTFGTLTAFLQILEQIKAPMKNMSGILPQYYSVIASAERIMELENIEDESFSEDIGEDIQRAYDDIESLCMENLSFSYDNDRVLSGAGFEIKKGEFVAIAGPSGIGKSTIIKLILGLIEKEEGRLYFKLKDKEVNVDGGTRRLFAYVPQGNMVLSGTIRENIAFCCPDADKERIMAAADVAMLSDFISSLPDGVDTIIGERGLGLSEGQIQRLAIARAILSDAPILLFDEATSALDEKTEEALMEKLKALPDKTCVFISHRQGTIDRCDRILRIVNKKIE